MKFAIHTVLLLGAQILVIGALTSPARADDRAICRHPEVLAFALNNFRSAEAHVELVANTATEIATLQAEVVICAVTVKVEFYDSADYRNRPAVLSQSRYFEVRRLRDGFEMNFDGR